MSALPPPVQDYVHANLLTSRAPAYLLVHQDGRLAAWGGELAHYGITDLRLDVPGEEQVAALMGLLPLEDTALQIPSIETAPGLFADLHIFPAEAGAWVLLLDATADVEQRHRMQQKAHEMALLEEDYDLLFGRHLPQAIEENPGHRVRGMMQIAAMLGQIFQAMDIVVMERMADGTFRLLSAMPAWLPRLYPAVTTQRVGLRPGDAFPFLEHFCTDAEAFWQEQRPGQLHSGPWRETDATGQEYDLEAFALCLEQHHLLCLGFPKVSLAETRAMVQKAREEHLAHAQLQKEIQQKDILLHCIVHDLAGPLTSIIGGLSFLAEEPMAPDSRSLLDISLRQARRQQYMIQEILDVFATEMGALEAFARDRAHAPDAAQCAQDVVRALEPVSLSRHITLQMAPHVDLTRAWLVVGETSRLERVIFNLVENALRHSPAGSRVTVTLEQHGSEILVAVDDEGPGVPPEMVGTLFEKFTQGTAQQGKVGLGLYFCRITVEHWGGTIGCMPRPGGGSRFWFRLPEPSS